MITNQTFVWSGGLARLAYNQPVRLLDCLSKVPKDTTANFAPPLLLKLLGPFNFVSLGNNCVRHFIVSSYWPVQCKTVNGNPSLNHSAYLNTLSLLYCSLVSSHKPKPQ